MHCTGFEQRLLKAACFEEWIFDYYGGATMSYETNAAIITAPTTNIKNVLDGAKRKIDWLQKCKEERGDIPNAWYSLLNSNEFQNHLQNVFKIRGFTSAVKIVKSTATAYASNGPEAKQAMLTLQEAIYEKMIKMPDKSFDKGTKDQWVSKAEYTKKKWKTRIEFDIDQATESVNIVGVKGLVIYLLNDIKGFLWKHNTEHTKVGIATPVIPVLRDAYAKEIWTLVNNHEDKHILVTISEDADTMLLSGNKDDFGRVEEEIQTMVKRIDTKSLSMQKEFQRVYFLSTAGKQLLANLQSQFAVSITTVKISDDESQDNSTMNSLQGMMNGNFNKL